MSSAVRTFSASVIVVVSSVRSASFSVVNVAASDFSDSFPAASTAVTVTLYSVFAVRAARSYSVPVISSSFTFSSFRYTLYPATSTLSLDAVQVSFAPV